MSKWPAFFLAAFSMTLLHPTESLVGDLSLFSKAPSKSKKTNKASPSPLKIRPLIEMKAGYFFFADSKMRKIYDQEGLDLQIAGTYPIWKWLQIYGSMEWFEKQGRSLVGHHRTHIWGYPVSLGLQGVATISSKTHYYFTIGPRFVYVHQHNNSPEVDRKINHSGIAGFVGTGFHFFPLKNFVIDIFGEYSYCRLHAHAHKEHAYGESAQVGGFVFGGGLGYVF